jgi:hypothetical protein
MSTVIGTSTSYDLTTGVKVNMDEVIYTLDPIDTPLLGGVGADGLSVISSYPVDETEFFWMHENLLLPRSINQTTLTTGDTVVTVTTGDRAKFSTSDVLVFHKSGGTATRELMQIASYGTTADTLIVTRGFGGTTAQTQNQTNIIMDLGPALPEGSDPQNARQKDRSSLSNYTQIFGPTKMSMSGTEQVVSKYGVANEFNRQLFNRTNEQAIQREQAYLYGVKFQSTTTKVRTTGGLDYHITTNVDSTATQLTVLKIQALEQLEYNQGGLPDRLIANPASLLDLNDVANTAIVRQTIMDTVRGRVPVMEVWSEFGPLSVVRHRWNHPSMAFLIKRDGVVRRVLRPFQMERLAKTGDSDSAQILVEEGLEVKGQQHMAKFTALAY